MSSPESDIFVMSSGGKDFVVRMNRQTPQLSAMTEYDLVESSLQRTFENVVPRGSYINVSVIPSGTLRIYTANSTYRFWQLQRKTNSSAGQVKRNLT